MISFAKIRFSSEHEAHCKVSINFSRFNDKRVTFKFIENNQVDFKFVYEKTNSRRRQHTCHHTWEKKSNRKMLFEIVCHYFCSCPVRWCRLIKKNKLARKKVEILLIPKCNTNCEYIHDDKWFQRTDKTSRTYREATDWMSWRRTERNWRAKRRFFFSFVIE